MKWSVNLVAVGDRVMSREEIVELADAVAVVGGIASGIGTNSYGAQVLVEAEDRDTAARLASAEFNRAVAQAGLPRWPIANVEAMSEADDDLPRWPAPPEAANPE